jgi:hypothetical protein
MLNLQTNLMRQTCTRNLRWNNATYSVRKHHIQQGDSLLARLTSIQESRLSNIKDELNRLNSDPKIRQGLSHFICLYGSLPEDLLVAYGRALQILKGIDETHYAFFHGASRRQMCLNILNTELVFQKEQDQYLKHNILLRHPALFSKENDRNIDWYKQNITGKRGKTDDDYRKFLISADFTFNIDINESAISQLLNPKVLVNSAYLQTGSDVIKSIIQVEKSDFAEKFEKISKRVYKSRESIEPLGDLYVICIPKANFSTYGYLSKPYGVPLKLDQAEKTVLENGQNEDSFFNFDCSSMRLQVRLLANKLIPSLTAKKKLNSDVITLIFPTMPDDDFEKIVNEIRTLVKTAMPITI